MRRVWKVKFVPTVAWVREVRAAAMDAFEERRAAKRAAKAAANADRRRSKQPEKCAATRAAEAAPRPKEPTQLARVDAGGVEMWKQLPDNPRYELSNQGRLRSPSGLLSPNVNGSSAATAKYQLWDSETRGQTSLTIRLGMAQVWGIAFTPTVAWILQVRKEAREARESGRCKPKAQEHGTGSAPDASGEPAQEKPEQSAASGKSSSPSSGDCMDCPFTTPGKMDKAQLPPGITTWDCAEMDPMTQRGENGVWIYVPATAAERRQIRAAHKERMKEKQEAA
jgi:hypothetical protein